MNNPTDLLYPVDWKNHSLDTISNTNTNAQPRSYSDVERVATLVLNLEQHVTDSNTKLTRKQKAINRLVKQALRDIEQNVIFAEQMIDYEE